MSSGPPEEPATLVDLLFYAPVGLILDAQAVSPELVARGRQNVKAARIIGRMAVQSGWSRLDEIVQTVADSLADAAIVAREPSAGPIARSVLDPAAAATALRLEPEAVTPDAESAPGPPEASTELAAAAPGVDPAGPPTIDGVDPQLLPIPGYDTLAASQVVKRLGGLTATELEIVRTYEDAGRARRSILAKIARLQAT